MFSAKKRIISRKTSRSNAKSRTKTAVRSTSRNRPTSRKKTLAERRYLVQKKRAEAAEKLANKVGHRYADRVTKLSRSNSRRVSSRNNKRTKDSNDQSAVKKSSYKGEKYSGTIIYTGKSPLNPFKWQPDDSHNQPSHYKWEILLPGTHVLDQNTRITWIVEHHKKLALAPCQTIHLDLILPDDLYNFNPGLCLNPFLPDITRIPEGTRFFFKDVSQCYQLGFNRELKALAQGNHRLSQVIPIAMNFDGGYLIGLKMPLLQDTKLQLACQDGYQNLDEWLDGLRESKKGSAGYLGSLPNVSQLQVNDILEFYDDQNEVFRMQVVLENQKLTGKQISGGRFDGGVIQVQVPIESTNKGTSIYIRSVALVPDQGEPLILVNKSDNLYYFDQDIYRLQTDLHQKLVTLGPLYTKIKMTYLGKMGDHYVIRFSNLPNWIWGVVMSSDQMPYNKYEGSGRFYLGHSARSPSSIYTYATELNLEHLNVREVIIDGHSVDFKEGELERIVYLNSNQTVANLLRLINRKLGEFGYSGYSFDLWWSEKGGKCNNDKLRFYLSGVVGNHLPTIELNLNGEKISLDF